MQTFGWQLRYDISCRRENNYSNIYLNAEKFVEFVNEIIEARIEYEKQHELDWDEYCEFTVPKYTVNDLLEEKYDIYKCKAVGIYCKV